jgi:RimJ/RimL family protein N-acetyltransferase
MSMPQEMNRYGQPVGFEVPDWTPPPRPSRTTVTGRFCSLEALDADRHAAALYAANARDDGRMWTYMGYGPFANEDDYRAWIAGVCPGSDPLYFAIVDSESGRAFGVASYLRIDPASGSIEVGNLAYSPLLQRTPAATEAMYLMMANAFALGYRRYEWKCNALNSPSRAAAQRLGLSYEGIFRQALIVKGRNRDTAWYATTDREWPALRAAFEQWLAPSNFDAQSRQRLRLSELTAPLLLQRG